jgi:hypothetical protein
MFALIGSYMPVPPGVAPPPLWGDPNVVRERLGAAVRDIVFDGATMTVPALSPQHFREEIERTAGPVRKLVESLAASDPARLAEFRRQYDALTIRYFAENCVGQGYLMTRAVRI